MTKCLFLSLLMLVVAPLWAAESECVAAYRAAYNQHALDRSTSPQLTALRDHVISSREKDAEALYAYYIDTSNGIAHESQEIDALAEQTGLGPTNLAERIAADMESGALCTADHQTKTLSEIATSLRE